MPLFLGLTAQQHATLAPAAAYYNTSVTSGGSPSGDGSNSPIVKYHENGHDTFSDFVTLVCQEAQSTQPQSHPGTARSPMNKISGGGTTGTYYTSSTAMYPPGPPAPMARPVTIVRPSGMSSHEAFAASWMERKRRVL